MNTAHLYSCRSVQRTRLIIRWSALGSVTLASTRFTEWDLTALRFLVPHQGMFTLKALTTANNRTHTSKIDNPRFTIYLMTSPL